MREPNKDRVLKLRLPAALFEAVHARAENASGYLRALIRSDIRENPELRDVPRTPYFYFARFVEAIDGDTIRLDIDAGFEIVLRVTVRLLGVNAPEIETAAGRRAKRFLESRLKRAFIVIETRKREKFGRYLAAVFYSRTHTDFQRIISTGKLLNREMIARGLAEKYDV